MKYVTDKRFVMFRPHDIQLFRTPPPEDDARPVLAVQVAEKHNYGWIVKYTLRGDDDVVRRSGHRPWPHGMEWHAGWQA